MNKRTTTETVSVKKADDTLSELWQIKDETARRYRTASEYFHHLGLVRASSPLPAGQVLRSKPTRTTTG
jgi:hypothetical protein